MNIYFGKTPEIIMYKDMSYDTYLEVDFNKLNTKKLENKFGKESVEKLLNHKTNYHDGNKIVTVQGLKLDKDILKIENTTKVFKLISIRLYADNKMIYSGNDRRVTLSNTVLGKHILKADVFISGNFNEKIGSFEIPVLVKDKLKDVSAINAETNNVIEFDKFVISLTVGSTPSVLVVKDVIQKDTDDVYEIQILNSKGEYEILGVGTELSFSMDSSDGGVVIEDNKKFHFKIVKVLSKEKTDAIGVLRASKVNDSLCVSNRKYYNIKGVSNTSNSVNIPDFNTSKNLITKYFNGHPLFYFFIIKGSYDEKKFKVVDEKSNEQKVIVVRKDDNLAFVYFNPKRNKSYFYQKNNYLIPIKYREYTDVYCEKLDVVDGVLNLGCGKYIDRMVMIGENFDETDVTIETSAGKTIVYRNIKKTVDSFKKMYKFITSKHQNISKELTKITFSNKNIKEIYNIHTNCSYSNDTIIMYKNSNDTVYSANKVLITDKETILSESMKTNTLYAYEDGKLVEYDDGYIELKSFDDFYYLDFIEENKEKSYGKKYSLFIKGENEAQLELAELYRKNFATIGIPMNITGGRK